MPLQVFTSQIYRSSNPDNLDITVKGGNRVFGPTWDMVKGYKDGSVSEEQYTNMYYDLMRKSYRENRDAWDLLLDQDKIVLCCYCRPGAFCHRVLLANILVKLGAEYRGEI